MQGPLAGTRVIEICSIVAGPIAGRYLGDMGASVIKLEPPDGLPTRTNPFPYDHHDHPGFTYRFINHNTSKQSVGIDLKTDEGKAVFTRLVESSDVLLENMRPGSMERLGFGWEVLQEINPELVYCSIKGYGAGPYEEFPAMDTLVQGISSAANYIGDSDRPETTNDVFYADILTGLYAAWGVTMALLERATSGTGQRVDVSMLDAAVSTVGYPLAEYTGSVHYDYEPERRSQTAPNGFYETADGYLGLLVPAPYWSAFCTAVDKPEWDDPDHPIGTNEKRRQHPAQLREHLEAAFADRTAQEWMAHFRSLDDGVLAAHVNAVEDLVEDPQITEQDAVLQRDHPALGEYYLPNVVPRFSRTPGQVADAPALGEHTDSVLADLGYTPAEIAEFREHTIVH